MTTVETLTAAVMASPKLDAGTKRVVVDFFTVAAPVIEGLGPGALADLLAGAARGEDLSDALVAGLTPPQVVALLGQTEAAMAGMVEQRAAQVAAARAALNDLANAALGILARVILGAL